MNKTFEKQTWILFVMNILILILVLPNLNYLLKSGLNPLPTIGGSLGIALSCLVSLWSDGKVSLMDNRIYNAVFIFYLIGIAIIFWSYVVIPSGFVSI